MLSVGHILRRRGVPYALLHVTSMYPTPYHKVRLGAMVQLQARFTKLLERWDGSGLPEQRVVA